MPKTPLALWMEQKGYTNSTLAEVLGLSYDYIYKLAVGQREPTKSFKWAFAQCFGLEETTRLFGQDTPQPTAAVTPIPAT